MNKKIVIKRKSSFYYWSKKYKVEIDGVVTGELTNGATLECDLSIGSHSLRFIPVGIFSKCEKEVNINIVENSDSPEIYVELDKSNGKLILKVNNFDGVSKIEECKNDKQNSTGAKYLLKGENGQLYVYENKIEISRKGVLALAFQGLKGTKTIPIAEIKSIQMKRAEIMNGYIQFAVSGGIESTGGVRDPNFDENTVTFVHADNEYVQEIKEYIEKVMLSKGEMCTSAVQISNADELRKYANLRDEGVITQEEFDAKKKQLLGL